MFRSSDNTGRTTTTEAAVKSFDEVPAEAQTPPTFEIQGLVRKLKSHKTLTKKSAQKKFAERKWK